MVVSLDVVDDVEDFDLLLLLLFCFDDFDLDVSAAV